jgi:hypothetical protein
MGGMMRCVASLCFCVLLQGCIALPIPNNRSLTPQVTGTVLDAQTMRPIEDVLVTLETQRWDPPHSISVQTSDDGTYRAHIQERTFWWVIFLAPALPKPCTGKATISAPGYREITKEFKSIGVAASWGPCGRQKEIWNVILNREDAQVEPHAGEK